MNDDPPQSQEASRDGTEYDWFLRMLVKVANSSTASFGITLQVSGMLVSGDLVNGKSYFEGFADELSGALNEFPDVAQSIRNSFAMFGQLYSDPTSYELEEPRFIHLRNARFFNTGGTPIPDNRPVWWRGQLSHVGGFILGRLDKT